MVIDSLQKLIESYGVAGSIVAMLIAIVLVIAGFYFATSALKLILHPTETKLGKMVLAWVLPAVAAIPLIGIGVLLAGIVLSPKAQWVIAYALVFAFGGAVGAAELISRYRDKPSRALQTVPALLYIGLNAIGSVGALYLIGVFREKLGFGKEDVPWEAGALVEAVLIAGFASLLFFRTNLFKLRVGDADLAVGPSIILDSLLSAADRAVDRVMAEPRAEFVHKVMADVAFDKGATILPAYCLALMQNVSSDEAQRVLRVVEQLRNNKDMPEKIKALNLGLALLTVVGEEVLATAVDGLKEDLQDSTAKLLRQVASVMHPVSFDRARRMLPGYSSALWPKPISDEMKALDIETTALAMLKDVPEDYKALILGIRIAKLTDGATLLKAVTDLGPLIKDAPSGAPTVTSATAATTLSSAAPASTAARTAATPTSDPTAKPSAAALSTTTAATDAAAAPATASAVTEDAAGTRTPTGPDTTSDAKSLGQPSPGSAQTNRTVGILAYGSLIDDPGSEIAEATDRTEDEQVMTPFKVEFARSSASRGGAPTLIPVPAGGREIPAKIFVMKNNVTEQDAIDRLWRREIDRIGSGRSYLAPSKIKADTVVIERIENFHDIGVVFYTRIAPNIDPLKAETLASRAIKSVAALSDDDIARRRDGISYLISAHENGARTELSSDYEEEIKRQTNTQSLSQALESSLSLRTAPKRA